MTLANNGLEAVQHWQNGGFDAILMDVDMPEMNGYEATRCIRDAELATGGHIRIVAMTAHAMQGAREECLSRGMDGYLPKPIDTEALWRELDSLAQSAVEVSVPKSVKPMRVADFALARQTMDDSRELFDEIVAMFLLDAQVHMQKIKDALVQEDASAIRHSAHTLKCMAGISLLNARSMSRIGLSSRQESRDVRLLSRSLKRRCQN